MEGGMADGQRTILKMEQGTGKKAGNKLETGKTER